MLIRTEPLKTSGTDWVGKNTISATSYNSDGLRFCYTDGNAAVLLTPTASSNATLSYELSIDDVNYYAPFDTNASNIGTLWNGSLTTSRYITFAPQAGEFIRFNFSTTKSNMSITSTFISQEWAV